MVAMTTEEEMEDIKRYIILPLLLDLVDRYMWFPEVTPLKQLSQEQFQQLLDHITIDHVEVKQRLRAANIKIVETSRLRTTLDYKIFVRRFEENLYFSKNMIKAEMSVTLGKYVAKLDKKDFKQHRDTREEK